MDWAQATVLIVPVITIVGAAVTVVVTYGLNQRAGRQERQVKAFAEALTAIEDYANMPYRTRRRSDKPGTRHEISSDLDKIRVSACLAPGVAPAYDRLISAARSEAGEQMKEAWTQPPVTSDKEMSLGGSYRRTKIDKARYECITAMCIALG
jgi:hypothetical protein